MEPKFIIIFYAEASGRQPVKDFINKLDKHEREKIGKEIKVLQFRWPLGMPLVGSLSDGLWELRVRLETRICRILFIVDNEYIILLHGFIKKTQKTPLQAIDLAKNRRKKMNSYGYA